MAPLQTRSGRRPSQNETELKAFIDLLRDKGVTTYLEVGSRHGDTFYEVMRSLPVGSVGLAVDLPGGAWGKSSSESHLRAACEELRRLGYKVDCLLGDSQSKEVLDVVHAQAPWGAILIDGDHRYEGVLADWNNLRGLSPLVAFHDIVGDGQRDRVNGYPVEVPRLWSEICEAGYDVTEIVAAGSAMGIGVVWG